MIKLNEKFLSPFVRANEVAQMEAELEAARKTVMDKSGAGSDFLGWLVSGYGVYFPLYTVGPVLLGLLTGIGANIFLKGEPAWKAAWKAILIILLAEVCSSLLYGTWALTLYYSIMVGKEVPFSVLFLARLSTKPVTMVLDALLAFLIHKAVYRTVVCNILHRPTPTQN